MSSFNPNNHAVTAAEWLETAREANGQTRAQFTIVGGVVLGLFAAAAASPVTGVLVAAYFLNKAWKDTQAANRNDRAIDHYGCVAPFLNEADLTDYARQVGTQNAASEIRWALENGFMVKPAALDFLEMQGINPDRLLAPARDKQALPTPQASTQQPEGEQSMGKQPIGVDTRLGAIPAQAVAVAQQAAPAETEVLPASPISYLIGDRLRSVLIVAVSGGGKDLLLSNAVREFLSQHPDFTVLVMDCKNDPKETGYYAGLPRTTVYRLDISTASESTALAWIDAALDDFNRRGEKALLVCNEGTSVRTLSKRYADVVSSFVSNGDSRQKYCWEAGQSAHTDDLKTNMPGRSRFRPLAIALLGEEMQVEAILQAKWFADSAKDLRLIETEMRRSPVKRAWSDGRRWYPMPELPNHSGYDRDSRSYLRSQPEPRSGDSERLNPALDGRFTDSEPRSVQRSDMPEPAFTGSEPERSGDSEPSSRSLNSASDKAFSGSQPPEPSSTSELTFMPSQFNRQQALELIQFLKESGQSQQQIIEGLWRVKKGGSEGWRLAREEYRQLTGE